MVKDFSFYIPLTKAHPKRHHTLAGADPRYVDYPSCPNYIINEKSSDPQDPIDPSHKGPVIVYLCVRIYSIGACTESDYRAQIPNATQTAVTGLKWFKIWEDGFDANNSTWGVDRLIANKGKHTFTIPSCIASGNYLVRTEIIGEEASTV